MRLICIADTHGYHDRLKFRKAACSSTPAISHDKAPFMTSRISWLGLQEPTIDIRSKSWSLATMTCYFKLTQSWLFH